MVSICRDPEGKTVLSDAGPNSTAKSVDASAITGATNDKHRGEVAVLTKRITELENKLGHNPE